LDGQLPQQERPEELVPRADLVRHRASDRDDVAMGHLGYRHRRVERCLDEGDPLCEEGACGVRLDAEEVGLGVRAHDAGEPDQRGDHDGADGAHEYGDEVDVTATSRPPTR
jgi:hypothetical protein